MLEILANKLMNPRALGKLFMLWVITTVIASAVSVSFVTNTASIAAQSENITETREVVPHTAVGGGTSLLSASETALPNKLIIETLGIDITVSNPQSTDIAALDAELLKNVVRYPTSGKLGESGKNIVIFGHSARVPTHRGMYRAFNDIEQLAEGETVALQGGGKEYVYRIDRVYKKSAETGEIGLNGNNNRLTLVTCDGFGKKSDRWIVEADFIGSYDL